VHTAASWSVPAAARLVGRTPPWCRRWDDCELLDAITTVQCTGGVRAWLPAHTSLCCKWWYPTAGCQPSGLSTQGSTEWPAMQGFCRQPAAEEQQTLLWWCECKGVVNLRRLLGFELIVALHTWGDLMVCESDAPHALRSSQCETWSASHAFRCIGSTILASHSYHLHVPLCVHVLLAAVHLHMLTLSPTWMESRPNQSSQTGKTWGGWPHQQCLPRRGA
jgi:hypothetical protein